ncbi:MAG TPA: ferric reductase-like transmembrane domain-containing protein, partial [Polyangiaceae bacterium]
MTAVLAASGNAKTLWYLTRGTGAVALLLLTLGVVLGVTSSTRWQTRLLPRFLVSALHRNITLLAVAFVAVHVVTTVFDPFAPIGYRDAFVPFLSPYRPIWLGLGAVAFDLLLALIATSLLRARIGLRAWRAVHWLAYASWPVALVHSYGTGSDARAGWLGALAVVCTLAVALAVLWRIATASGHPQIRLGGALAVLVVPLGILLWARSGPLEPGWASRAGTPKTLLASHRFSAPAQATTPPTVRTSTAAPVLPRGAFQATFRGRLHQGSTGGGMVVVVIDGTATGGFDGRVHVALRGVPVGGGGVQMVDSSVGLLPRGARAWAAGTVVALEGQRV